MRTYYAAVGCVSGRVCRLNPGDMIVPTIGLSIRSMCEFRSRSGRPMRACRGCRNIYVVRSGARVSVGRVPLRSYSPNGRPAAAAVAGILCLALSVYRQARRLVAPGYLPEFVIK
jgi:hypothetical protein